MLAACGAALLAAGAAAGNQDPATAGRLEFVVRVTPGAGRPEPARGLTIFLISKSFHDIGIEAEGKTSRPDQNVFIDHLEGSKDLKDWMKRQHSVTISGVEFRARVSADDLFKVPEFLDAYTKGNVSAMSIDFPKPKYKPSDRTKNPEKYEEKRKIYAVELRKYLEAHPASMEEMDTILEPKDPSRAWQVEEVKWRGRAHALALQLAQTEYLAAKTVTNLEGQGAFQAAPGEYWLSSLDGEALGGEHQLRWDVPVEVRPGRVTRVELSDLNNEKKP